MIGKNPRNSADVPCVLTIAGSDCSGGAGVQADLKTFTALKVYGASAITALTAQNTVGVQAVHVPPIAFFSQQLESIFSDLEISAVKTGMLPTARIVSTTADFIKRHGSPPLVVDPVLVATSGDALVDASDVVSALKEELFPLATVVTPNVPEAEKLTGITISSDSDRRVACQKLIDVGCNAVLLKGGHTTDVGTDPYAIDILYDGQNFEAFSAPRIETNNTHGTGCTLSSAIAAFLARGFQLPPAVNTSKAFVFRGIEESLDIGNGCGPLYHMHTVSSFSK